MHPETKKIIPFLIAIGLVLAWTFIFYNPAIHTQFQTKKDPGDTIKALRAKIFFQNFQIQELRQENSALRRRAFRDRPVEWKFLLELLDENIELQRRIWELEHFLNLPGSEP